MRIFMVLVCVDDANPCEIDLFRTREGAERYLLAQGYVPSGDAFVPQEQSFASVKAWIEAYDVRD